MEFQEKVTNLFVELAELFAQYSEDNDMYELSINFRNGLRGLAVYETDTWDANYRLMVAAINAESKTILVYKLMFEASISLQDIFSQGSCFLKFHFKGSTGDYYKFEVEDE